MLLRTIPRLHLWKSGTSQKLKVSQKLKQRGDYEEGYNELHLEKRKAPFDIAFEVLKEPIFAIGCMWHIILLGDYTIPSIHARALQILTVNS